eukprot:8316843-Karenia_brevis.AAC.1
MIEYALAQETSPGQPAASSTAGLIRAVNLDKQLPQQLYITTKTTNRSSALTLKVTKATKFATTSKRGTPQAA